jgi:tRNA G18 (ribose-2'-O)-methylase SpoU
MKERTLERRRRLKEVLRRRQPDLTVLMENVHKPHNLSAILRTCDAVGTLQAHAVNPTGGVPTFNETSGEATSGSTWRSTPPRRRPSGTSGRGASASTPPP